MGARGSTSVVFGVICGHVQASDIVTSSAVGKAVSLMRDEDLGMKAHMIGSWSGVTMSKWSMLAPDVWAGLFRTGRRPMIKHAHVRVERGTRFTGLVLACTGVSGGSVRMVEFIFGAGLCMVR